MIVSLHERERRPSITCRPIDIRIDTARPEATGERLIDAGKIIMGINAAAYSPHAPMDDVARQMMLGVTIRCLGIEASKRYYDPMSNLPTSFIAYEGEIPVGYVQQYPDEAPNTMVILDLATVPGARSIPLLKHMLRQLLSPENREHGIIFNARAREETTVTVFQRPAILDMITSLGYEISVATDDPEQREVNKENRLLAIKLTPRTGS